MQALDLWKQWNCRCFSHLSTNVDEVLESGH